MIYVRSEYSKRNMRHIANKFTFIIITNVVMHIYYMCAINTAGNNS